LTKYVLLFTNQFTAVTMLRLGSHDTSYINLFRSISFEIFNFTFTFSW